MSNKLSIFALAIALLALGAAVTRSGSSPETSEPKESAFNRVMRTRTLRCAYATWPPFLMMDPNTKKITGANYEIMEAIGRTANLKIEWVEELGFGLFPDNLRLGKEDAWCTGSRASTARAQRTEISSPIAFSPLYACAREDDTRFDGNSKAINADTVTISIIDGSTIESVAKTTFPKAKIYTLPEMADLAQAFDAVALKKADIIFSDEDGVVAYNKFNPTKRLRRVTGIPPLRTLAVVFPVAKGEWELRDLLNVAIGELQGDGTIDGILSQYEATPNAILHVAKPYIARRPE